VRAQLQALLAYVRNLSDDLTAADWLSVAQATALLCDTSRTEEGLPTEVSVIRSVSSLEDALAVLSEENQEAEET
jgi:hypothetical protein